MFENLLHQDTVVERIQGDLTGDTLPPSILFSGPALSGKLTAALELARGLSCSETRAWNCPCSRCRAHRTLSHPRTVIAGYRDMAPEIAASAEVLRRDSRDGARYLFVRSVRKLLKRFDPFLWEGDEKKLNRLRSTMEQVAENIDTVSPGGPPPDAKQLKKILDDIVASCADIQKILPAVLPVAQVRRIESWAAMTAGDDHKTVIVDGADRMPAGSRNALLKFLEEPPSDTTIILLTDRKGLIIPTVLSRLREYSFRRRRPVEEAAILEKVFKEDEGRWGGLTEFFMAWRTGPVERLRELAVRFIDGARGGERDMPEEAKKIEDAVDFASFLEALTLELRTRWIEEDGTSPRRAADEAAMLREARVRAENLYMTPALLLRGLYASLGEGHSETDIRMGSSLGIAP